MVDVGEKDVTARRAVATGQIQMQASTLSMISDGEHPKGDVLAAAVVGASSRRACVRWCLGSAPADCGRNVGPSLRPPRQINSQTEKFDLLNHDPHSS